MQERFNKNTGDTGRIYYFGGTYNPFYYLTDHLGSTRVISNSSGIVVERNGYYPFGGEHGNSSYPKLATNRFKFNGKELQTTGNTRYLDYGARMYDDVIGRWGVMDPLADHPKQIRTSPYIYSANNPIRYIDPSGMTWEDPKQAERINQTINNRIENIDKNSKKIQAQIDKGGLSEKNSKT